MNNYNNDSFELLFWKVFKNKYIFNNIFYQLENTVIQYKDLNKIYIGNRLKFKEIKELKWFIKYKQWSLLKCKLEANEYIDIDEISLNNMFEVCFNENLFYLLFKNCKTQIDNVITNSSSRLIFENSIFKFNNLISTRLLISLNKIQISKSLIIQCLMKSSLDIVKLIFNNLTNDQINEIKPITISNSILNIKFKNQILEFIINNNYYISSSSSIGNNNEGRCSFINFITLDSIKIKKIIMKLNIVNKYFNMIPNSNEPPYILNNKLVKQSFLEMEQQELLFHIKVIYKLYLKGQDQDGRIPDEIKFEINEILKLSSSEINQKLQLLIIKSFGNNYYNNEFYLQFLLKYQDNSILKLNEIIDICGSNDDGLSIIYKFTFTNFNLNALKFILSKFNNQDDEIKKSNIINNQVVVPPIINNEDDENRIIDFIYYYFNNNLSFFKDWSLIFNFKNVKLLNKLILLDKPLYKINLLEYFKINVTATTILSNIEMIDFILCNNLYNENSKFQFNSESLDLLNYFSNKFIKIQQQLEQQQQQQAEIIVLLNEPIILTYQDIPMFLLSVFIIQIKLPLIKEILNNFKLSNINDENYFNQILLKLKIEYRFIINEKRNIFKYQVNEMCSFKVIQTIEFIIQILKNEISTSASTSSLNQFSFIFNHLFKILLQCNDITINLLKYILNQFIKYDIEIKLEAFHIFYYIGTKSFRLFKYMMSQQYLNNNNLSDYLIQLLPNLQELIFNQDNDDDDRELFIKLQYQISYLPRLKMALTTSTPPPPYSFEDFLYLLETNQLNYFIEIISSLKKNEFEFTSIQEIIFSFLKIVNDFKLLDTFILLIKNNTNEKDYIFYLKKIFEISFLLSRLSIINHIYLNYYYNNINIKKIISSMILKSTSFSNNSLDIIEYLKNKNLI